MYHSICLQQIDLNNIFCNVSILLVLCKERKTITLLLLVKVRVYILLVVIEKNVRKLENTFNTTARVSFVQKGPYLCKKMC